MKYIDQWLTGLGLEYILPTLKEKGITTPKRLAQLSLRDIYDIGILKFHQLILILFHLIYKEARIRSSSIDLQVIITSNSLLIFFSDIHIRLPLMYFYVGTNSWHSFQFRLQMCKISSSFPSCTVIYHFFLCFSYDNLSFCCSGRRGARG